MPTDLEIEEQALGKWPRRLLYVPEMVSYAWQPGNTYNGIKEPDYNAITYTWGRWRLEEHELPEVDALDISIDGDDWPIPRVNPEHFTSEQLDLAVVSAASWTRDEDEKAVDFIWLDIACIAQREDAQSAAEIGRQALIFKGANYIFLWLTSLSDTELKETIDDLWWFEGVEPSEYTPRHSRANRNLVRLLNDPWFSSLWTLQEAFLRQDAYLLSSDPDLVPRSDEGGVCDMADILYPCASWNDSYNRITSGRTEAVNTEYQNVARSIEQRGLIALTSQHEISTYVAAQCRTTSREEDRIYGLQQVFRLRLGKTALKPAGNSFTLSELENQFGEALLLQHPVHSQMHVFVDHVPVRDRWRIRSCSRSLRADAFRLPAMFDERLPQIFGPPPANASHLASNDQAFADKELIDGEEAIWDQGSNALVIHCSFSIDRTASAPIPVTWRGRVCSFSTLWELSDRIYRGVHLKRAKREKAEGLVDDFDSQPFFPLFVDLDAVEDLHNTSKQAFGSNEVAALLSQRFPNDKLQILLLASCWPTYTSESFKHGMFGLLLLPQQEQWARIGVCQWPCEVVWTEEEMDSTTEDELLLSGNGSSWVEKSGILGFVD